MNPGYFFIGFFLLLGAGMFSYLAWKGQISFGNRVLIDRRTDRLGFWAVYIVFLLGSLMALNSFFDTVNHMAMAKAMRETKLP